MTLAIFLLSRLLMADAGLPGLEAARNRQDRVALEKSIERFAADARTRQDNAEAQYRLALANSYLAEVAMEMRDKTKAREAAEAGMEPARRAVALDPRNAEHHRILGTLCGQVIPANVLLGLRYGRCAQEEIEKAVELNPHSAAAYLSRGVGNYYLPASFGGGVEPAIRDFQKALDMDHKFADAYLWLGIALRKAGKNGEARKAIEKSLELNPNRIWARQQLKKTPAR
ncbi:MAG: tetratricopeptide repeat protein [Bryobacterales bacterium]|nr:tetratricopeptide repeat protein [Bryobacterales bacterium]MEB2361370.1 tetratricopeptide repeat protein [Bryobacterales bacterium]